MNWRKARRFILILLRDLLILVLIGNILNAFTIDRELWSV